MSQDERPSSLLDLLALVQAGRATIAVGGRPLLSINSDAKSLEIEADGVKEAGLHLSRIVKLQEGSTSMLEGSRHVVGALSRHGWKLTLYAEGDEVLTMGSGVSRLTGRVSLNPLKLRKLLEALR
jgi:hypothetical protein